MNYDQFHKMLKQALKDKAPAEYRKMRDRRTVDRYLGSLTTSALETKDQLETQAIDAVRNQDSPEYQHDSMKAIQEINSRFKAAEEVAVAHAIEAIEALQQPSETYETMEPLPPGPTASGKPKLPIRRELILKALERNKNNPPKRRKPTPSNVVPFRKPSKS